jgi:hypothetical protein
MTDRQNELPQSIPNFVTSPEGPAMSNLTFTTDSGATVTASLPRTTHLHSVYADDAHAATVADVATGEGSVTQVPAAPTDAQTVTIQLGAGALALALLVATVLMIKKSTWTWSQVLSGFALGTVMAGAQGLMGTPAQIVTSLFTSLGTSLGTL